MEIDDVVIRFWPDTEPMEIPPKLKEYIDNNRGSLPPVTDPDEPLHLDSLSVIRLVAFLESELGYWLEDEELIAENFETLRKLGALLASKEPTQVASPVQSNIVTFIARRKGEEPDASKS
jgi:acyl carrier protein